MPHREGEIRITDLEERQACQSRQELAHRRPDVGGHLGRFSILSWSSTHQQCGERGRRKPGESCQAAHLGNSASGNALGLRMTEDGVTRGKRGAGVGHKRERKQRLPPLTKPFEARANLLVGLAAHGVDVLLVLEGRASQDGRVAVDVTQELQRVRDGTQRELAPSRSDPARLVRSARLVCLYSPPSCLLSSTSSPVS